MTTYMISWKSRAPGRVVTEPVEAANLEKLPIELLKKFEPRIGKRWRKQPYCEVAEAHGRNDCGFFFVQGKRTYRGQWWEVEA